MSDFTTPGKTLHAIASRAGVWCGCNAYPFQHWFAHLASPLQLVPSLSVAIVINRWNVSGCPETARATARELGPECARPPVKMCAGARELISSRLSGRVTAAAQLRFCSCAAVLLQLRSCNSPVRLLGMGFCSRSLEHIFDFPFIGFSVQSSRAVAHIFPPP
jgi:hypothetical protein